MSKNKRLLALLLCLLMTFAASTALAAKVSKTFTTIPTIKVTAFSKIETYDDEDYTVTLSNPGFLTIRLVDESGAEILTIADHIEAHSKATEYEFVAVDASGEPLPLGNYSLVFDLVNQFGVSAKTLEKSFKVIEMSDYRMEQYLEDRAEKNNTTAEAIAAALPADITGEVDVAALAAEADSSKSSSSSSSSSSASSSSVAAVAPPTNEVTYTAGSSATGDEGLLIGVGVGDIATQTDAGYWGLTAASTDEEIWAAITREMVGVDVGENESAYIYDSPLEGRSKLGTVSGISQGLNVILKREDGWSLVETFRNEDGAFVRGYIKSNKLRPVTPNKAYGIVIDKATQTLTVYKDGARLGSCQVSTGLPTPKYLHRETPAGEFILVTRRGSYDYYGMGFTANTIRINGNYYLAEVPTTKKNGTKFLDVAGQLGHKATRGTVVIAHEASSDGGINSDWIWDMTDSNKKVKVLIFDDKARTEVPVSAN